MATRARGRMIPELHHLRHRRGDTTGIAASPRTAIGFRGIQVVWRILVPGGLDKEMCSPAAVARTQLLSRQQRLPVGGRILGQHRLRTRAGFDDPVQIEHQFRRRIPGFENALVGIAHQRTETVVGGDDDKSTLIYIEYIKAILSTGRGAGMDPL